MNKSSIAIESDRADVSHESLAQLRDSKDSVLSRALDRIRAEALGDDSEAAVASFNSSI